jgi:3alpha(or 20beta)-hydroxysteroid dehydrogenase
MTSFAGGVYIITGAARGQGAEQARRLVSKGAHVVISDILDEEGRDLVSALGTSAIFVHHDVTSEENWVRLIAESERFGTIRGLVNNAGIYRPVPLLETEVSLVQEHFRVNQLGSFLGMKHGGAALKRLGRGSIVNISSTTGLRGTINSASYGATKWAIRGMTKTAAIELAPYNVRVNSVHPGLIDTAMLDVRRGEDLEQRKAKIPMGRMGTVMDVANAVLFLLSDESDYITGAEIAIDGGLSL